MFGKPAERARSDEVAARLRHALDLAHRYLELRERTVLEVRRHLEAKRIEPDTIEQTIAELLAQRHLDDARYARCFTEDRRALDSWGSERIERRLLAAGVAPELIAAALAEREGETELEAAVAVLRRRFPIAPETDRDCHRALGMLVRKGYELDLAHDAIRAYRRT